MISSNSNKIHQSDKWYHHKLEEITNKKDVYLLKQIINQYIIPNHKILSSLILLKYTEISLLYKIINETNILLSYLLKIKDITSIDIKYRIIFIQAELNNNELLIINILKKEETIEKNKLLPYYLIHNASYIYCNIIHKYIHVNKAYHYIDHLLCLINLINLYDINIIDINWLKQLYYYIIICYYDGELYDLAIKYMNKIKDLTLNKTSTTDEIIKLISYNIYINQDQNISNENYFNTFNNDIDKYTLYPKGYSKILTLILCYKFHYNISSINYNKLYKLIKNLEKNSNSLYLLALFIYVYYINKIIKI